MKHLSIIDAIKVSLQIIPLLETICTLNLNVEEEVFVVYRGRYNNNKVYYRLSHDVVT